MRKTVMFCDQCNKAMDEKDCITIAPVNSGSVTIYVGASNEEGTKSDRFGHEAKEFMFCDKWCLQKYIDEMKEGAKEKLKQ